MENIGDLLPILIFLIIGLMQAIGAWLKKKKKPDETQDDYPTIDTNETDPNVEEAWDELMEALGGGKKEDVEEAAAPKTPPVVEPVPSQVQTPPPLPQQQTPPPTRTLIDIQKETAKKIEAANREAERIASRSKPATIKKEKTTQQAYQIPAHQVGISRLSLAQTLQNKNSLRQAIIINELLQPPVSMR